MEMERERLEVLTLEFKVLHAPGSWTTGRLHRLRCPLH